MIYNLFRGFSKFYENQNVWDFLGHGRFHKKIGHDRFSRFDVYRLQTSKQTNKHQNGRQGNYIKKM